MESFRNLIRGWLGKALLVLFLVPFALVGIEGYFASNSRGQAAVDVGKQKISRQEFDQAYGRQRQELLAKAGGDESRLNDAVLRQDIMRSLVNRALLQHQADKLGLELSTMQVAELIRSEPSFQENGVFSESRFAQFLQSSGQSRDQLIAQLRQQMAVQQLASGIAQTGLSPTRGIDRLLAIQGEKRQVHTAHVPLDATNVAVSDTQVQQHFASNARDHRLPMRVDLEYMVLDQARFLPQVSVTEADVQARYQERLKGVQANAERHAQHILIPVDATTKDVDARKLASDLLARIQKGEDFAALAKQYSKDPGSATNGGDLGFAPKGTYVPAFEAALDRLQNGQVAPAPVKTEFGYHIIKLLETRQPDQPSLDSLRAELTEAVQKDKATALFNDAISRINEQAVDQNTLAPLAQSLNLPLQSATQVTKTGQGGDLAQPDVINAAFADESLQDQRISPSISLQGDRVMWLRVTKVHPERPQTLAEAAPAIRAQLQAKAALAQAKSKAAQVVAALNAGQSLDAVSRQFGVAFADAGLIERAQGLPNQALQKAVFRAPAPAAGRVSAILVENPQTGVDIGVVSAVQMPSAQDIPADAREQSRKMLADLLGQQELGDYVEYLRNHIEVKQNEALLKPTAATTTTSGN